MGQYGESWDGFEARHHGLVGYLMKTMVDNEKNYKNEIKRVKDEYKNLANAFLTLNELLLILADKKIEMTEEERLDIIKMANQFKEASK